MKFKRLHFNSLSTEEQEKWKANVFNLLREVAPKLERIHSETYFFDEKIETFRHFFTQNKEGKLIAFFCGYYQIVSINNKKEYLYNSRFAVSPAYQGNSFFTETFIAQFKAFGMVALRKGGYWVSNMVNPISYHGVASACKIVFPRFDTPLTPKTTALIKKYAELNNYNLVQTKQVLKITTGVAPIYSKAQIDQIYQSKKPNIQFFLAHDINFLTGEGIAVVIPYTFKNISLTVLGALKKRW